VPSWAKFEAEAPELAARVRERFEAHGHKTLATLRRDGSPRISGTEAQFRDDDLWIGSMWNAVKALDLRRDPRYALHSASEDPDVWTGDAKIAGIAEEVTDPAKVLELNGSEVGRSHLFRLDVMEATRVGLSEDRKLLVIETWTPRGGVRRLERS
jgi:Pyridoxamine 5'-phosphate oxidase